MRNTAIAHIKPGEKLDGREVREVEHVRNPNFLGPRGVFAPGASHIAYLHYADGTISDPKRLDARVVVEEVGS